MSALPDTLWAALPVPAYLLDAQDCIAQANPAAEQFANASQRSLRGQGVWRVLQVNQVPEGALARVRGNQAPLFVNDIDIGAGGRAVQQCSLQIAPMGDDDPDLVLLLVTPRDIAGHLGRGKSPKSSARSAIGMAEMLAHEIKNPLAGITGAAQLLSMTLSRQDQELTDLIVAESRRIVALLEQVEQFGNLSPPALRPTNIHDLLDRARRTARLGFASHMRVVEDYDPSLPPALIDGDQILQVLLNLLRNATEAAGDEGGTIRLHSYYDRSLRLKQGDGPGRPLPLQVEVIDDGPGLPPDIAADVFEPFVSGRENGTGLGLALAGKIISDHDGWIAVDSQPGHTVFRLSLPIAPTQPQETL